jgi:WD40 repeat protein
MLGTFFIALSLSTISSVRAREQSFTSYELRLNAVLAAALAPDGTRVAVVTSGTSSREASDDLQVWDFRAQRLLFERKAKIGEQHDGIAERAFPRSLAFTPDGQTLVYCDGAVAHIFDASHYDEVRSFPVTSDPVSQVRNMRISSDGKEMAVRVIKPDRDFYFHGGFLLNIYDLKSGVLKRSQKFESALDELGDSGIAWSPDGTRLALILEPTHEQVYKRGIEETLATFPELAIIGSDSAEIRVRTEHWAGDLAFVGNESIVSVARETASGSAGKDSLRLWDAKAGKLQRQMPSKPDGAHDHVQVSRDGRILLAYAGKDRRDESSVSAVHEPRFRLWDTATWAVLFTSPPLRFAARQFDPQELQFALSSNGGLIMVWDSVEAAPVCFYEWR